GDRARGELDAHQLAGRLVDDEEVGGCRRHCIVLLGPGAAEGQPAQHDGQQAPQHAHWFGHWPSVHSVVEDRIASGSMPGRREPGRARRGIREPVNGLTHILGAVVAIVASVPLVLLTRGDWLDRAASVVFGLTSVVLFVASSLLHSLWVEPSREVWLRRFDHAAIFTLIAGTYTPILVQALRPDSPRLAWTVLAVVWAIALLGLVFKLLWIDAP